MMCKRLEAAEFIVHRLLNFWKLSFIYSLTTESFRALPRYLNSSKGWRIQVEGLNALSSLEQNCQISLRNLDIITNIPCYQTFARSSTTFLNKEKWAWDCDTWFLLATSHSKPSQVVVFSKQILEFLVNKQRLRKKKRKDSYFLESSLALLLTFWLKFVIHSLRYRGTKISGRKICGR